MRVIFQLIFILLCFAQSTVAVAGEIYGQVQLIAESYILIRSESGQQVVRTDAYTAYGNLAALGALKNGGDIVKIQFDNRLHGVPLATAVLKDSEYVVNHEYMVSVGNLEEETVIGGAVVVDCRSVNERSAGYIPGSLQLSGVDELAGIIKAYSTSRIVIFYGNSSSDMRPYLAARAAKAAGLSNVKVLTGGVHEWRRAGKVLYTEPSHLANLSARGIPFRLIDLRSAASQSATMFEGAERFDPGTVTSKQIFMPDRSYQLPIYLYGDDADSRAVAVKLAGWNFHNDGDFAIVDPAWKDWQGKFSKGKIRPWQLAANEIELEDFRSLWQNGSANAFLLNVKIHRDRPGSSELHIPLEGLLERMGELPRDKELIVYCSAGLRSAVAWQILKDNGFKVRFLNRVLILSGDRTQVINGK